MSDDQLHFLFGPKAIIACNEQQPEPEHRLMICDGEEGHPFTNHEKNEAGEWVCLICGFNVNAALAADQMLAERVGFVAGIIAGKVPDERYRWLEIFIDTLVLAHEDRAADALRDLVNIIGRRQL